jgi:subtilisin family serine protease
MKKLIVVLCCIIATFVIPQNAKADTARAVGPVEFKMDLVASVSFIGASKAHQYNYKGQGSYVVVIDSGVETSNPFLASKVVLEACFATICPDGSSKMIGPGAAKPVHWHGTHVAGIIAGSNSSMSGVAPQAAIIAVNVFDPSGSTYDANIVSALDWVNSISSKYNIAAVNMSLGTTLVFTTSCDNYIPELTSIISKLKSKNIATVVSAGNSYAYGMSSPACITDTISVAATYSDRNEVTKFSNVHENTDFSAPGFNIFSSELNGSFRSASGTSMAAPHVAGAYAVYRSKFGVQSVNKVTQDFRSSSVPAKDEYTSVMTKRIDLNYLFGDGQISTPTTSTTVVTTTTTLPYPVVTTTTVVAPKPPNEDVEFIFTAPEILSILKDVHGYNYVYLDFRHVADLNSISNYLFHCIYTDSTNFSRSVPNRGNRINFFYVAIPVKHLDSCRMAAVYKSGFISQYTSYFKIK